MGARLHGVTSEEAAVFMTFTLHQFFIRIDSEHVARMLMIVTCRDLIGEPEERRPPKDC
jgi:hypothetical protein